MIVSTGTSDSYTEFGLADSPNLADSQIKTSRYRRLANVKALLGIIATTCNNRWADQFVYSSSLYSVIYNELCVR